MKTILLILFTISASAQYFHLTGGAVVSSPYPDNLAFSAGIGYGEKVGVQAAYRLVDKVGKLENTDLQISYTPIKVITFLAGATYLIPDSSVQPIAGVQFNIPITEENRIIIPLQVTSDGTNPIMYIGVGFRLKMVFSKNKRKRFF